MPTLDQLKKQYDKLSARERYALMMAAHARGDTSEAHALAQAAPRKVFSFPNTSGLQDGFQFVAMMHIMSQLGHAAGFYFMMLAAGDEPLNVKIGDNTYTEDNAIRILHRNIIGGRDAFRMLCEEYKLDPNDMLQEYPFMETIEIGQVLVRSAAQEMEATEAEQIELEEYTRETLEAYRVAIAHHAEGWE